MHETNSLRLIVQNLKVNFAINRWLFLSRQKLQTWRLDGQSL